MWMCTVLTKTNLYRKTNKNLTEINLTLKLKAYFFILLNGYEYWKQFDHKAVFLRWRK